MRNGDPLGALLPRISAPGTAMNARTASGTTLRWEVQRDMLKPDQLVMPVLATTGLPGPEKPPRNRRR